MGVEDRVHRRPSSLSMLLFAEDTDVDSGNLGSFVKEVMSVPWIKRT